MCYFDNINDCATYTDLICSNCKASFHTSTSGDACYPDITDCSTYTN